VPLRLPSLLLAAAAALPLAAQRPPGPDPAKAFFARHDVVAVHVQLAPGSREKLREKPREYAPATLRLGDVEFQGAGVKLKGAAGSFRPIDERPGFTVHLGKFGGTQRFHGLLRFHLNNGAQDETRLCEWIGHDVFTAAGHPAPRVAHARVRLDDQDHGLYVLREAFDRQFLERVFGTTSGNLYDGGFCQDVDAPLEKDSGDGPDDRSDLQALHDACAGVDRDRQAALAAVLDVDAFLDFIAIERMLGHWDGYSVNRNNFRLWIPTGGAARFLPHGMDQLFGDADATVLDHPPAIAASALMQQPALRKRFRERLRALLPLFAPTRLAPRLEKVAARLRQELRDDAAADRAYADAVRGLLAGIAARHESLRKQVRAPEPKPLSLAAGKTLALKTWNPSAETADVELARKGFQGMPSLLVRSVGKGDAERHGVWRTHLLLAQGRYALRAIARCEDVAAGEHGGMFLQVGDATSERVAGDRNWGTLRCEFAVAEFQRTVEFTLHLHTVAGAAWFRADSLLLERLPD
jgi:spore coat protein H